MWSVWVLVDFPVSDAVRLERTKEAHGVGPAPRSGAEVCESGAGESAPSAQSAQEAPWSADVRYSKVF